MSRIFTSESVSEGHPDKVADQVSDAILDAFLSQDSASKVACEVLTTTGLVILSGEVKTTAYVPVEQIARQVILDIGYNKSEYKFDARSCGVVSHIHEQSPDINQGVERASEKEQGAGDQGIMFGYATNESDNYMPLTLEISHLLLKELAAIRKEGKEMTYLRPDSKSQVTIEYDEQNRPVRIDTIVISTQHDDFAEEVSMLEVIRKDIKEVLIPRIIELLPSRLHSLFDTDYKLFVNPTGKFVIGGPHGDTGLTGRKIIVDTYGGRGAHGGGAFSGKDSSKVDRSAAYAARHLAKNLVASGVANQVLVQLAYAIGVAQPVSIFVDTYGTSATSLSDDEIADKLLEIVDLTPYAIIQRFGLNNPIFLPTARYGHFGRESYTEGGMTFFGWEKLDLTETFKETFKVG